MQRETRANKNLNTAKPSPNFAATKKFDPDKLHPTLPNLSHVIEQDPGPMGQAKVARGRTVHVPTGIRKVIGSKGYEVNGAVVYRDVTQEEFNVANPGDTVTLPQTEIDRLMELGFLQSIDDHPAKVSRPRAPRPDTGIKNDPRVGGMNSLTTSSTR
jgi:hypothetical protein